MQRIGLNRQNKSANHQNYDFSNIAGMVQNNTQEVLLLMEQVDSINSMVKELEALLEG